MLNVINLEKLSKWNECILLPGIKIYFELLVNKKKYQMM